MKDLVLYLAKALADHPDKVALDSAEEAGSLKLTLKVAEEDKGKIIGKKGKVIRAMRALVAVPAAKAGKKVLLDID